MSRKGARRRHVNRATQYACTAIIRSPHRPVSSPLMPQSATSVTATDPAQRQAFLCNKNYACYSAAGGCSGIPSFFLVPDRQHRGPVTVHPVEDGIAAVSKRDQPLPECRVHLVGRSAYARMRRHNLHSFPDRPHSTGRCDRVLRRKEPIAPLDAKQGLRRPDQLWHSGGSTSCPASSCASQVSASSWVTCRPVS